MHQVRWCFHATAMVYDYEETRDALTRLVGCRVLEDTIELNPRVSRRGGMTWIGDSSIELGQPIASGAPTAKFLGRHGPGLSSVAVQVADLEATADHLDRHDVRFIWADPTFGFSHPRDTAGVLVQWFEGPFDLDPRAGGPLPDECESLLDVARMAFVGAVVDDPAAAAERLAALLATAVTFVERNAAFDAPAAGVSLGDMTLALYPRPEPVDARRIWGMELAISRVHAIAVLVPDLADARAVLTTEGIVPIHETTTSMVLPLDVTGDVCVVVTDRLLPNDPRESN